MSFHVRLRFIITWIDLYSSEDRKRLKTPDLVSAIRAAIYRMIKAPGVQLYGTDDHPFRMIARSEPALSDRYMSHVHEYAFITLSMGMPDSARSWNYIWWWCIVLYLITGLLSTDKELRIPHSKAFHPIIWFLKKKWISTSRFRGQSVIDIFGSCDSKH